MKKIYLSPSDQVRNIYAYGDTNEAAQCRKIASACKAALERNGFAVRTNFEDGTNAMYTRVAESNTWGADLHLCIHTNAGGGKGAEAYVIDKRWRSCCSLSTLLSEIAKWIVNSTTAIGEAIAKGVCRCFGVGFDGERAEEKPAVRTTEVALEVLRRGSEGTQVKTLQRLLKQLGYKDEGGRVLSIDGRFGPATDYAVRKFQKNRLNGSDGIVGAKTWAKLLK